MVFNKDILFIHIGKTGGTSAANYLCKTLNPKVYNVIPRRAHGKLIGHEELRVGQRHATLEEAIAYTKEHNNMNVDDFKEIIAVIRHPYNLEISLFNYYKRLLSNQPDILDNAPLRKEIVSRGDFVEFVKAKFYHRHNLNIRKYVSIEGKIPKNVRIVKFENMVDTFIEIGQKYGNGNLDFPHLNKTKPVDIREYINSDVEEIIYRKYNWVFSKGKYERTKFTKSKA